MKKTTLILVLSSLIFAPLVHAEGKTAVAIIKGTVPDSPILGKVELTENNTGGVAITAQINGVPVPGKHGFHIHEKGSCADLGNAAGGHFNPHKVMHGDRTMSDAEHAHPGDMGNITVDEKGKAALSVVLPDLSLSEGDFNVSGLAIILHEKQDDFGQPTGNAGGRIACGIIEVRK